MVNIPEGVDACGEGPGTLGAALEGHFHMDGEREDQLPFQAWKKGEGQLVDIGRQAHHLLPYDGNHFIGAEAGKLNLADVPGKLVFHLGGEAGSDFFFTQARA